MRKASGATPAAGRAVRGADARAGPLPGTVREHGGRAFLRDFGVVGGRITQRADGHAPVVPALPRRAALPGGVRSRLAALGLPGVAPCGDGARRRGDPG